MKFGWMFAAVAMAACASAWAEPEPSRHEKTGLEITFPEKWIVGSGEEPLLLISRSMDRVSLANCVATGEEIAGTRSLTQDQINQSLTAPFGADFWRQVYSTSGLIADVKSAGARVHKSGVMIQEAYFDLSREGAAPDAKTSLQQAIFVRPGLTVTVACSARTNVYPKVKDTLTAVIDSVRFGSPSVPVASAGDAAIVAIKDGVLTPVEATKAAGAASRAGAALMDLSK